MNLGKYIHELLLVHETVIIPGFGAFISNYKPAEINETQIKPPSKEISFSQQIRNNDGLLVGHVSYSERISHLDALKIIEKERENITYLLDKGEKVTLKETGILFYNQKNEIEFTAYIDDNLLLDSFGLEPILFSTDEEGKFKSEPIEEIAESEKLAEEENNREHDEAGPIPNAESNAEPEIQTEEIEEQVIPEPISSGLDLKNEAVPEPEPAKESIPPLKQKAEKRKNRTGFWYLLILVPILVAGFFVLKNNSSQEKPSSTKKKEIGIVLKETPEKKQELIAADTIKKEILEPEVTENTNVDSVTNTSPKVEEEKIVASGSPVYYLVGGSFKEEENAGKYMIELQEKGFEPFYLGKKGNFYIVALGTYKTESEAVTAKREFIEKSGGSGVWIMEE